MKKFYILIIVILSFSSFNINSMVIHGQLDEGFIPKEGESQHLFFMGLDAILLGQLHSTTGINVITLPFYSGTFDHKDSDYLIRVYGNPMLFLPMVSLGYNARWQINNKFEINFNAFMSSPNAGWCMALFMLGPFFMLSNIWGPGVSIGLGFKRKVKEEESYSLSYKFNIGVDYSGDLHGAISLKNSILIGVKKPESTLSFNPFLNFCLKFGSSFFMYPAYYNIANNPSLSGPTGGWIVIAPGFELVSKVTGKNNFIFISTFMVWYEADFIIMQSIFTYGGKIILSSSFGIGTKVKNKKTVEEGN